jgi:hypothetical protein
MSKQLFLNIRVPRDSRSTDRRKTPRSIPSSNPSISTIRGRHIGRLLAFHKGGFDPTTALHTAQQVWLNFGKPLNPDHKSQSTSRHQSMPSQIIASAIVLLILDSVASFL